MAPQRVTLVVRYEAVVLASFLTKDIDAFKVTLLQTFRNWINRYYDITVHGELVLDPARDRFTVHATVSVPKGTLLKKHLDEINDHYAPGNKPTSIPVGSIDIASVTPETAKAYATESLPKLDPRDKTIGTSSPSVFKAERDSLMTPHQVETRQKEKWLVLKRPVSLFEINALNTAEFLFTSVEAVVSKHPASGRRAKRPREAPKVLRRTRTRTKTMVCHGGDPSRRYKGTEPSPKGRGYCAYFYDDGKRMRGKDGFMWVVKQNSRGIRQWRRVEKTRRK
jgi:hypothetical protein